MKQEINKDSGKIWVEYIGILMIVILIALSFILISTITAGFLGFCLSLIVILVGISYYRD